MCILGNTERSYQEKQKAPIRKKPQIQNPSVTLHAQVHVQVII